MIKNHLSPKFVHLPEVFSSAVTIQLILINRASGVIFSEIHHRQCVIESGQEVRSAIFPRSRKRGRKGQTGSEKTIEQRHSDNSIGLKMRNRS